MASQNIEIGSLCDEYHAATDDGREQVFQKVWTFYYRGPDAPVDELANTLKTLLFSLDVLPKEPVKDSSWIEVMQEICSGMQRFCLSMPPGIDYAWNAMTLFILKLGDQRYEKDQFDVHAFAVDDLKYWVAEYPSWDRCDMQGVTECSVRDDDNSVLTVTQDQWDENPAEQLAALARNRQERNKCVVDRVIAARALRDGYAPAENFLGASELRYIEFALRRGTDPERHKWRDDMYQTSCDVIAATFCLRAGASSILECLPVDGCEFPDRWRIAPVKAGLEGRRERLEGWRKALEGFVVDKDDTQKGGSAFAVVAYAATALENLQEPRDETSAELFSWDNVVF